MVMWVFGRCILEKGHSFNARILRGGIAFEVTAPLQGKRQMTSSSEMFSFFLVVSPTQRTQTYSG
jgi:hypothetical protein